MAARRLRIRGRVQGVGFRMFVQREAERRGLTGWVRNRVDGSMEAVAEGPDADVEAWIEAARRGPPSSRVTDVQVTPEEEARYGSFELLPTG